MYWATLCTSLTQISCLATAHILGHWCSLHCHMILRCANHGKGFHYNYTWNEKRHYRTRNKHTMLIRIRKWKNMNCGWLIFRYQRHCNIVDVSHRELNERPRSHSPHLMVGIWHQTKMHAWFRFSEAAAIHNSSKDNSIRLDSHCWKYSRNTMI